MRCGLDYEVIGKQHSWAEGIEKLLKPLILDGIFRSFVAGQKDKKENKKFNRNSLIETT